MQKLTHALWFAGLLASLSSSVFANPAEEAIQPIQNQWAEIKYRVPEKQQAGRYHALAEQAGQLAAAQPNHAEALIWQGIALSSEAGAKGGLGALSIAKAAKKQLEAAIQLNGDALNGSAYTSLGTLYYKVPGWPIGFGDKAKAEELLKKALAINPLGIDPNFFTPTIWQAASAMPRPCATWKSRSRRRRVPAAKLRIPVGGRKFRP